MRIFGIIILIFALMCMTMGTAFYQSNSEISIYDITNNISWNDYFTEEIHQNLTDLSPIEINNLRIHNIIYKFGDSFGYSSLEVSKYFIEFGYNNPHFHYDNLYHYFYWFVVLVIVSLLVPLFIPMLAIICIIFISIKDLIKRKRKKDETV